MELYSHYRNPKMPKKSVKSWKNHTVNDGILHSYRNTKYNLGNFPSNLHYHDYYELIIVEKGDIRYVCESRVYYPQAYDIIVIPPKKFHMSAINSESTQYARHVFYFYPSAFEKQGINGLCGFVDGLKSEKIFSLSAPQKRKLAELLKKINSALEKDENALEKALGISYIIQFFYLLNQQNETADIQTQNLPKNLLELKEYVDENYAEITSISNVAQRFFYSREHVSRLFKKYFDISLSHYVLQRRILEGQRLILEGNSITDTAYAVGFNCMSAFIKGFKQICGVSPSKYRQLNE